MVSPLLLTHIQALHSLISHSFENRKGYQLVLRKQYALEDHSSSKELDQQRPFSLRRGMKVNMSMIFPGTGSSSCPRCHAATGAQEGQYVQWWVHSIGKTYTWKRRLMQASDSSATQGCGLLVMVLQRLEQTLANAYLPMTVETDECGLPAEEPSDFCRVRLFSRHLQELAILSRRLEILLRQHIVRELSNLERECEELLKQTRAPKEKRRFSEALAALRTRTQVT